MNTVPTQAEIAKRLGVSRQAVGFALGNYRNSRTQVSAAHTRKDLEDAVRCFVEVKREMSL